MTLVVPHLQVAALFDTTLLFLERLEHEFALLTGLAVQEYIVDTFAIDLLETLAECQVSTR